VFNGLASLELLRQGGSFVGGRTPSSRWSTCPGPLNSIAGMEPNLAANLTFAEMQTA